MKDVPEGGTSVIKQRHPTHDEALAEASRLARKEGCRFLIAEVTHSVEPDDRPLIVQELTDPVVIENCAIYTNNL